MPLPPACLLLLLRCSGLGVIFPTLAHEMATLGIYWYRAIAKLGAKRAKLTPFRLRSNDIGHNERGLMKAIEDPGRFKCPKVVGSSFETDGHQVKWPVYSSFHSNPGPHGITKLHKRGYQVRHRDSYRIASHRTALICSCAMDA